MITNEQLRRDVRKLADLLGEVIREHAGQGTLDKVETVRRLSRDRRNNVPGAEAELGREIASLDDGCAQYVARAFSISVMRRLA